MNSHTFSVSEVFDDGRVMVVTYVHIGAKITMVMDVYDDQRLSGGKRYLDVQLNNGETIPQLERYEAHE